MNDVIIEKYWYDDEKDITYTIRFIKVNDIWYAVLKDVCDAVGLSTWGVSQRLETKFLLKRTIPVSNLISNEDRCKGSNLTRSMILISEQGIYKAFAGGKKLRARKFTDWWTEMLMKSVTLPGGDVEQVEYDGNDYQVIHY